VALLIGPHRSIERVEAGCTVQVLEGVKPAEEACRMPESRIVPQGAGAGSIGSKGRGKDPIQPAVKTAHQLAHGPMTLKGLPGPGDSAMPT
jgi:hypothetical protein